MQYIAIDWIYVGDGCMAITDSLRTEVARITNVRSGRAALRRQGSVVGSFMMSKPPLPMKISSGSKGHEADIDLELTTVCNGRVWDDGHSPEFGLM